MKNYNLHCAINARKIAKNIDPNFSLLLWQRESSLERGINWLDFKLKIDLIFTSTDLVKNLHTKQL